jgi:hypothetical protein
VVRPARVAVGAAAVGGTTTAGTTLFEASDGALVPAAFVAATVQVYAVPLVRPATVAVVAGAATVVVAPCGLDVMV